LPVCLSAFCLPCISTPLSCTPAPPCPPMTFNQLPYVILVYIGVPDSGKGVCAHPVERAAILEVKGPGPPGGVSERQLSPDRGGKKT
jgi:hypothetical protein